MQSKFHYVLKFHSRSTPSLWQHANIKGLALKCKNLPPVVSAYFWVPSESPTSSSSAQLHCCSCSLTPASLTCMLTHFSPVRQQLMKSHCPFINHHICLWSLFFPWLICHECSLSAIVNQQMRNYRYIMRCLHVIAVYRINEVFVCVFIWRSICSLESLWEIS